MTLLSEVAARYRKFSWYVSSNYSEHNCATIFRLTNFHQVLKVRHRPDIDIFDTPPKRTGAARLFFTNRPTRNQMTLWQIHDILSFMSRILLTDMKCCISCFCCNGGNVAVLCQKTPTHPMCSFSLLLYTRCTHTHAHIHTHKQINASIYIKFILCIEMNLSP